MMLDGNELFKINDKIDKLLEPYRAAMFEKDSEFVELSLQDYKQLILLVKERDVLFGVSSFDKPRTLTFTSPYGIKKFRVRS